MDSERCVGHGRCYEIASEVFGDDERGHCVLLSEEVPAGLEDKARLGADNCPEDAILVEE